MLAQSSNFNLRNSRKPVIAVKQVRVVCALTQKYATQCIGCGGVDTELVTFAEAAAIVNQSVDQIVQLAVRGKVHLGIRPEAMLVCLNSLVRANQVSVSASVATH